MRLLGTISCTFLILTYYINVFPRSTVWKIIAFFLIYCDFRTPVWETLNSGKPQLTSSQC